ncbi:MAG: DNA-binding protein [Thiotrichales bacterium]|nr:MAG: DNA-binding protein [Thiotrichales bacterium]
MYKRCLTEVEASQYIGMSRSYLRQDRANGILEGRTLGPSFVKMGRAIRYLQEDLDAWIDKNRVTRSPDALFLKRQSC